MKDEAKALDLDRLTQTIIGAAIEVHRHLGPGLLESAYEECLCYEFSQAGLSFLRQVHIPIEYKGVKLDCKYRLDLIVEDGVIVEIKAIERLDPIHSAQLLTYLKATDKRIGLLINFNVTILKTGLKRLVNHHIDAAIPLVSESSASSASSALSPRLSVSAVNPRPQ